MANAFVSLTLVADWASRKVQVAKAANTLATYPAAEVLEEASGNRETRCQHRSR